MKNVLIILLILILWPAMGRATVRYVDSNISSDCTNYDPTTRACGSGDQICKKAWDTAIGLLGNGDTIYVMPQTNYTFSEGGARANVTIEGYSGNPDDVILSGGNEKIIFFVYSDPNLHIRYLTFKNTDSTGGYYAFNFINDSSGSDGFLLENCKFIDCGGIFAVWASDCTVKNCEFIGGNNGSAGCGTIRNDSTVTFSHCVWRADNTGGIGCFDIRKDAGSIYPAVNFYNCSASGIRERFIWKVDHDSVLQFTNCAIYDWGKDVFNSYSIVGSDSNNVNFTNCVVVPRNPPSGIPEKIWDGAETKTNITRVPPNIQSHSRRGIITFSFDDGENYADMDIIAEEFARQGWHFSYVPELETVIYAAYDWQTGSVAKTRMVNLINAGHDLTAHTYSHSYLTGTEGLQIGRDVGAGNSTVTISMNQSDPDSDNWSGTITLGTGEEINVNGDRGSCQNCTLSHVVLYIDGLPGWNCNHREGAGASGTAKTVCLADCGATTVNQGSTVNFDIDQAEYLQVEIDEIKAKWETEIQDLPNQGFTCPDCAAYECTTFGYPFGDGDDTVEDALRDANYEFCRGGESSGLNGIELENLHMFSVATVGIGSLFTRTGNEYTFDPNKVSRLIVGAAELGHIYNIFGHGCLEEDEDPNMVTWEPITRQNLRDLLAYIAKYSGQFLVVGSLKEANNYIRTNGAIVDPGTSGNGSEEQWGLTFTDQWDGRLRSGSPCIDAGINLGDGYNMDFLGYDQDEYGDGWEIGPYAYTVGGESIILLDSFYLAGDNNLLIYPSMWEYLIYF